MNLPPLKSLIVSERAVLRDALQVIDKTAQGIVFIVRDDSTLVGVLTDGDIRRLMLEGISLDQKVGLVMQRNFVSRPFDTTPEEILKLLTGGVRHIPLVDAENKPVDYACTHRLHSIQVAEPHLPGRELEYLTDCIRSNWISSQGPYVRRFETMIAELCDLEFALAVCNGTVGLHLALKALGVGPGDEVIVPDLTFAASINAIIYCGAIPVLVDISPETWTIDPSALGEAISARTKVIMPVHLYGHPCHMDEIIAVADRHNLAILEDCAEALGSAYQGKMVGGFGRSSVFSFFGNKTITTGEGGMVVFSSKREYVKAKQLRDHGMSPEKRYWHEEVGFNYRMTNLQAAIGVAQMERVDEIIEKKRRIASIYNNEIRGIKGVIAPPELAWAKSTYWLYTVLMEDHSRAERDELIRKLLLNGIETRPVFFPLHQMPPYRQFSKGKQFPVSDLVSQKGISFPSSVVLQEEEIRLITQSLKSILGVRTLMMNG